MLGLHPGNVGLDIPVGENHAMAQTFINQFAKAHCNSLVTNFRTPGWVHPAQKLWWGDLTLYVLEHFDKDLKRLKLHEAIRATCYKIEVSVPNFYAIFELYFLTSGTFFTPIGDLRLALHEM